MDNDQVSKTISLEKAIEEIKQLRNNRIQSLLRTPDLMAFLEDNFSTVAVSAVKLEFLKRDLKTLSQSTLDLVHYSSALRQIKESNPDVKACLALIEEEMKTLAAKYGYEKS